MDRGIYNQAREHIRSKGFASNNDGSINITFNQVEDLLVSFSVKRDEKKTEKERERLGRYLRDIKRREKHDHV